MASRAELRAVISAQDEMTGVLKGMQRALKDFNASVKSVAGASQAMATGTTAAAGAATGAAGAVGKAGEAAKTAAGHIHGAGQSAQTAAAQMQAADHAAHGMHGSLKDIVEMAKAMVVAMAVMKTINLAFSAAYQGVIGFNASLEQTKVAFTTMLGSGSQAEQFLEGLEKFAAETPFEFPDLVTASRRMMAFGLSSKQVMPVMEAVGNTVAAFGGNAEMINRVTLALGQVQSKGKVSAQEMLQLAEAGVPAWQILATAVKKPVAEVQKLAEQGKISSKVFIDAFVEFSKQNYGDMMKKQSQTFLGALSTIKDSLLMVTSRAFRPLFEEISKVAVAAAGFVQSKAFTAWGKNVAQVFQSLLGNFSDLQKSMSKQLGPLMALFQSNLTSGLKVVQDIWDTHIAAVLGIVSTVWDTIVDVVGAVLLNLVDIVKVGLQVIQGDWSGAWETVQNIFRRYAKTILHVGERFLAVLDSIFGDAFRSIATTVTGWLNVIGEKIAELARSVRPILARLGVDVSGLDTPFRVMAASVGGLGKGIGTVLSDAVKSAIGWLDKGGDAAEDFAGKANPLREFWANLISERAVRTQQERLDRLLTRKETRLDTLIEADRTVEALADVGGAAKSTRDSLASLLGGLGPLIREMIRLHPAAQAAATAIDTLKARLTSLNAAQQANSASTAAAQEQLRGMQDRVSQLSTALSTAKSRLDALTAPKLKGMGELDEQIFQIEQQIKREQLLRKGVKPFAFGPMSKEMEAFVATLPKGLPALEELLAILQLQKSLKFDEDLRAIAKEAKGVEEELTFDEAIAQIIATKAEIGSLGSQLTAAEQAVRNQEAAIRSLEDAGRALSAQIQVLQEQLRLQEQQQQAVNDALRIAFQWFVEDRWKLIELGGEAVTQAEIIDENTRSLLAGINTWSKSEAALAIEKIAALVAAWELARAQIAAIAAGLPAAGPSPPDTMTATGLQHGGIVRRPTFALLGEAGPEAVVPLSTNRASSVGAFDMRQLADILIRAMNSRPIIIQLDGQTLTTRAYGLAHSPGFTR